MCIKNLIALRNLNTFIVDKDNIPTRSRQRFILQDPDNGGAPCPEVLQEIQQCIELPLCHQFQWKISNWSLCILAPTTYNCGRGLRARGKKSVQSVENLLLESVYTSSYKL